MQRARRAALVLVPVFLALLASPPALAQEPWIYYGGEPGVTVTIAGVDITAADHARGAIILDPTSPVDVSISLASPPNVTWEIRTVTVGLLVKGPGSTAPEALTRANAADASLPPGFTVVINRTLELGALQRAGAGTFLMEAQVIDVNETSLYTRGFYIRVPASPASLLTVQGAAITAISIATGYGFWQVAKDIKEFRDVWDRHRKKKQRAKLDVIGAAEHATEEVVAKVGHGLDKAVALHRAVQDSEKQLGPVRWAATGLGLGGVAIAWLQFLGYLAFDAIGFVVTALEGAAIFLMLALVANALLRRAKRAEMPAEPTHSIVPTEAQPAETAPLVHPADKRG